MNYLNPQPPFVWPEPRVLADVCSYERRPPFSELAGTSRSVFGIVSAITAEGVEFLESLLRQSSDLKADLIVMVYPACATRRAISPNFFRLPKAHRINCLSISTRLKISPTVQRTLFVF